MKTFIVLAAYVLGVYTSSWLLMLGLQAWHAMVPGVPNISFTAATYLVTAFGAIIVAAVLMIRD